MQRLTLVLVVGLLLPGVATAATVTITYNITGGIVISDDDPEPITGGQFKVTLPATGTTGSYSLLSGAGTLQSFAVTAFGVTPSGYASTAVTARLTAPAAVLGNAAGRFTGAQKLQFTGNNVVHCDAPDTICTNTYSVPKSVPQTYALYFTANNAYPTSYFFFDPGVGSVGNGNLLGYYSKVGGGNGPATVTFTGVEVSRVFTPEPGGAWLATSALASLCGLSLWARRRRRA